MGDWSSRHKDDLPKQALHRSESILTELIDTTVAGLRTIGNLIVRGRPGRCRGIGDLHSIGERLKKREFISSEI
jgi:hypothetical protein